MFSSLNPFSGWNNPVIEAWDKVGGAADLHEDSEDKVVVKQEPWSNDDHSIKSQNSEEMGRLDPSIVIHPGGPAGGDLKPSNASTGAHSDGAR